MWYDNSILKHIFITRNNFSGLFYVSIFLSEGPVDSWEEFILHTLLKNIVIFFPRGLHRIKIFRCSDNSVFIHHF